MDVCAPRGARVWGVRGGGLFGTVGRFGRLFGVGIMVGRTQTFARWKKMNDCECGIETVSVGFVRN